MVCVLWMACPLNNFDHNSFSFGVEQDVLIGQMQSVTLVVRWYLCINEFPCSGGLRKLVALKWHPLYIAHPGEAVFTKQESKPLGNLTSVSHSTRRHSRKCATVERQCIKASFITMPRVSRSGIGCWNDSSFYNDAMLVPSRRWVMTEGRTSSFVTMPLKWQQLLKGPSSVDAKQT